MITYIYILNKFSDKQDRINLEKLSLNFELDNNYKSVSFCNNRGNFNKPAIKIQSGFYCPYCINNGEVHDSKCINPFDTLLTTEGIQNILKSYTPKKPKNPDNPKYILYRWVNNSLNNEDMKKLKDNVSIRNNELIVKPGKTLLSLKQVIVKRGKISSKPEGKLCKQPNRAVINYLSNEGKYSTVKVSKLGSVNIWSSSKEGVSSVFLNKLCKKINDTEGAVDSEYTFMRNISSIKSATMSFKIADIGSYEVINMESFQKTLPDNKDFNIPGLGKVVNVGIKKSNKLKGVKKSLSKTIIYIVLSDTRDINLFIYEQEINIILSDLTGLGNDVSKIDKELEDIRDKVLKILPSKKLINVNKHKVKLNTFQEKQIKHNTVNGKSPNGKACRKTSGQDDRQTKNRPLPYSFNGKCSDGLYHKVGGNEFQGLWYPCCYSLGKEKEKQYRQYLIKGFGGPLDDSKTGTLIPGTTQRETRKFKGLYSKSKRSLIHAINKIRPPCNIKFIPRPRCNASAICPTGWDGYGKTKFYYLTNKTISIVLENDYICYYIPINSRIHNYSVQYNKFVLYSTTGDGVFVRDTNEKNNKGLCIIDCNDILFKKDLEPLKDNILTNFGKMENKYKMLMIPKDSNTSPWLLVHKEMRSENFDPINLQVFKNNNKLGYYNLGNKDKIYKQLGNVYLKSRLKNKVYYTFKVSFTADGNLSSKLPFIKQDKNIKMNNKNLNNTIDYFNRNMTLHRSINKFFIKFEARPGVYGDNKNGMRLTLIK